MIVGALRQVGSFIIYGYGHFAHWWCHRKWATTTLTTVTSLNTFAQNGDYCCNAGSVAVDNGCIYGNREDWNLWWLLYLSTTVCMYSLLHTHKHTSILLAPTLSHTHTHTHHTHTHRHRHRHTHMHTHTCPVSLLPLSVMCFQKGTQNKSGTPAVLGTWTECLYSQSSLASEPAWVCYTLNYTLLFPDWFPPLRWAFVSVLVTLSMKRSTYPTGNLPNYRYWLVIV